jgi:hypothetical protein
MIAKRLNRSGNIKCDGCELMFKKRSRMRKHYESKCPGNAANKDARKLEYIFPALLPFPPKSKGNIEEVKSEESGGEAELELGH